MRKLLCRRYHTWISRTCLSLYESNGRDRCWLVVNKGFISGPRRSQSFVVGSAPEQGCRFFSVLTGAERALRWAPAVFATLVRFRRPRTGLAGSGLSRQSGMLAEFLPSDDVEGWGALESDYDAGFLLARAEAPAQEQAPRASAVEGAPKSPNASLRRGPPPPSA